MVTIENGLLNCGGKKCIKYKLDVSWGKVLALAPVTDKTFYMVTAEYSSNALQVLLHLVDFDNGESTA